jgi:hypothetical protein
MKARSAGGWSGRYTQPKIEQSSPEFLAVCRQEPHWDRPLVWPPVGVAKECQSPPVLAIR